MTASFLAALLVFAALTLYFLPTSPRSRRRVGLVAFMLAAAAVSAAASFVRD